jgi:hypothetical protein
MGEYWQDNEPKTGLYPTLNGVDEGAVKFRLTHITELQKYLEREVENYMRCRRRYATAFCALNHGNTVASTLGTIGGGTSVGLLCSGIGAPVGIVLGGVSLGCTLTSFVLNAFSKRVVKKLKKHESISMLAYSKLSSIKLMISRALEDSKISNEEFKQIQLEVDNYKQTKLEIQKKIRKDLTPTEPKKDFLEKDVADLLEKLRVRQQR